LLNSRIKKDFLYIPSDEHQFVILILHSAVNKQKFQKRYLVELNKLNKKLNKDILFKELNKIFSKKLSNIILKSALNKDYGFLIKNKSKILFAYKLGTIRQIRKFLTFVIKVKIFIIKKLIFPSKLIQIQASNPKDDLKLLKSAKNRLDKTLLRVSIFHSKNRKLNPLRWLSLFKLRVLRPLVLTNLDIKKEKLPADLDNIYKSLL